MKRATLALLGLLFSAKFLFAQTPQPYEIIIDEIMADPTPPVGLPSVEFIEVKNASGRTINLAGWRLSTSSGTSASFLNYVLPADSFLIICSSSSAALLSSFGKTLAVSSFPALDNDGTLLSLQSKEGKTIHAVAYSSSWYRNPVKKDGGWSLEMIDTKNPCTGKENWIASDDVAGGTPGRKNNRDGINNDETPPQLLRTYCTDSITMIALFSETLDSIAAANANYSLGNPTRILSATPLAPLFDRVSLNLSAPLKTSIVYTLTVANAKDCRGNLVATHNTAKAGWPQSCEVNNMVVNEILFNPRSNAFDYVEFYNRSDKIIDISKLYIANKNSGGVVGSIKKLSDLPLYVFPGDYIAVTEDPASLQVEYLVKDPDNILPLSSMPSFPDDEGTVVLMNAQEVIDEVHYLHNWHFALISEEEGIALERIDPFAASQDFHNWHSAASTAGYGTPGYRNSQYKTRDSSDASVEVQPKIFSPDNDGFNDVATISYNMKENGFVASVTIFDANGRRVRDLEKNVLPGLKGSWNWDGLDGKNSAVPTGVYVICTEFFNPNGKRKFFKNVVVLTRRN